MRPRSAFALLALALLALGLLLSGSLAARPAPWYLWKSALTGEVYCAQTSPGEGWVKKAGPFRDARCRKPARTEESARRGD